MTLKAFGYHQAGNLKESCDYYLRLANEQEQDEKPIWHWHKSIWRCGTMLRAISYIEKLINRKSGLT